MKINDHGLNVSNYLTGTDKGKSEVTETFPINQNFERYNDHTYFCTQPSHNVIKCNCLHESTTTYALTNFQDNHYFYDWGMVEEISIPEENLSTCLTWKRISD